MNEASKRTNRQSDTCTRAAWHVRSADELTEARGVWSDISSRIAGECFQAAVVRVARYGTVYSLLSCAGEVVMRGDISVTLGGREVHFH